MARHCSAGCRQQLTTSAVLAFAGWTEVTAPEPQDAGGYYPSDLNSSLHHRATLPHVFTFTQVFMGKELEKGTEGTKV